MTVALAMILDAMMGEPRWLWSRVPHPAVLMGHLIGWADARFNGGENRQMKGTILVIGLSLSAALTGMILQAFGPIIEVIVIAILLAQKSLAQHVQAVADALRMSVLSGRKSVAMIVGRDTDDMNEAQAARAAIESAAENLSDGVIAPVFWCLIGGLPGLLIYKITNTADSMIGYKTPRHQDFGWAAARFDDVLNWVPARLSSALIALSVGCFDAHKIILRDAGLHRSPNAGWPEAAMAASLDISLSGPRAYNGQMQEFPWVHPKGRRTIGPKEIDASVKILWRTWALTLVFVICISLFV